MASTSPKTLHARVDVESDGYRKVARTTRVAVDAITRDERLVLDGEEPIAGEGRYWRSMGVGLAVALPMLVMLVAFPPNVPFFAAAGVLILGAQLVAYRRDRRMSERIRNALPAAENEIVSVTIRDAQTLTLEGVMHKQGPQKKEVRRVRVEDSIVDERKTLRAEYSDGSEGVLLADLSDDEIAEVCAHVRAHDLPVDGA